MWKNQYNYHLWYMQILNVHLKNKIIAKMIPKILLYDRTA